MFVRKNRNSSESLSIQIVQKINRKNKVLKTVGIAISKREEELLMNIAQQETKRIQGMESLFIEHDDLVVESFVNSIANDHLQIEGSELILGNFISSLSIS